MTPSIRQQFPMLVNHPDLVYLDSAATTLKPYSVIEAITNYYQNYNANVGRSSYQIAEKATCELDDVRQMMADFIGANSPQNIIFTSSATSGLNQLAFGLTKLIKAGDIILISNYEHNSNIKPWQIIAKRQNACLKTWPDDNIDWSKVKVLAYCSASNVTGQLFSPSKLSQKVRANGGIVLTDATQLAGRYPLEVKKLPIDGLVLSGHKIYAPSGVGVIYATNNLLTKLTPLLFGSGDNPWEPGTPNIEGIIGLGAALKWIKQIGLSNIYHHDQELVSYATDRLRDYGLLPYLLEPAASRIGIMSLSHPSVHPHDIALYLDDQKIAVRTGLMCADHALKHLGLNQGAVRLSFGAYTTPTDIDQFIDCYKQAIQELS